MLNLPLLQGSESFSYKYKGDIDAIDLQTLLTSQLHFLTIVNEVQRSIYPGMDLKIKVETPKKGSFELVQLYEWALENNLFNKASLELLDTTTSLASNVFGVIGGLYTIYAHLKGKKAKSIEPQGDDKIKIINNSGDIIIADKIVLNLYTTNQSLNEAFKKQMEVIEEDPSVEGIEIVNNENKNVVVDIPRSNFPYFQNKNEYLSNDQITKPKLRVRVFIKKPDLFPKSPDKVIWELIHEGRNIKAKIIDPAFIEEINKSLRVGQGDSMLVDLNIIAEYDKRLSTHIDKTYEIAKVYSVDPKPLDPEQKTLFS